MYRGRQIALSCSYTTQHNTTLVMHAEKLYEASVLHSTLLSLSD